MSRHIADEIARSGELVGLMLLAALQMDKLPAVLTGTDEERRILRVGMTGGGLTERLKTRSLCDEIEATYSGWRIEIAPTGDRP
jgi:hypothetical protein